MSRSDSNSRPQRTLRRPRIAPGVHVRRASARKRKQLDAAEANDAMDRQAQTLDTLSQVVTDVTGLTVGEAPATQIDTYELVVEVDFHGPRSGRFSLALSRGLTRQVGAAMAAMVDLNGQPLNAIEAAKELALAVVHQLLQSIFGPEVRCRLGDPQASPSQPLSVDGVVQIGVADGMMAVSLHFDASQL